MLPSESRSGRWNRCRNAAVNGKICLREQGLCWCGVKTSFALLPFSNHVWFFGKANDA